MSIRAVKNAVLFRMKKLGDNLRVPVGSPAIRVGIFQRGARAGKAVAGVLLYRVATVDWSLNG
jgi:hypothetical protein